jgi:hypothetical protein
MIVDKDCWQTPLDLYEWLDKNEGPFFWDACCNIKNCLVAAQKAITCESNILESHNCLSHDTYDYLKTDMIKVWKKMADPYITDAGHCDGKVSENIFMNPPYSNPGPFIQKAWEDSKYFKLIILVPISILSCKYLDFLEDSEYLCKQNPTRKWREGVKIVPLSRRTKFVHPNKKSSSPPGGCMLMIFDRRGK